MPPAKAKEWSSEQKKHFNFSLYQESKIYTCVLDKMRRPSAIPGGKDQQKCIDILLEE
jgi:hypothetical protein